MRRKNAKKTKKEILIENIKRHFVREEADLYNDILSILEYDVNPFNNYQLEYNGLPIKCGNKKLIKLCGKNIYYDNEEYMAFRPLKNTKHCNIILDYIQFNEHEDAVLYTHKIYDEEKPEEKPLFKAELRSESEGLLAEAESTENELFAKFKCLYIYFYGDSEELNKKLQIISDYNKASDKKTGYIKNSTKKKSKEENKE